MTFKKSLALGSIFFIVGVGGLLWFAKNNPPPSSQTEGYSSGSSLIKIDQPFSNNTSVITDDDPFLGSKDAPVKIVEFLDFQCPYCKQSFPIMRRLVARYPETVFYQVRDLPLTDIHEHALLLAEAGACAHAQNKFWALHDKMFLGQETVSEDAVWVWAGQSGLDMPQFTACMQSHTMIPEIQADAQAALDAGARGTPLFVINGQVVNGVIPEATFEQIVADFKK